MSALQSIAGGARPGADLEEVPLEHRHVVCPTHGEPFRAEWPLGWDVFAPLVADLALRSPALQTGLADPAFWREPGLLWGDLPTPVGRAMIRKLLDDRPACEWVRPQELLAAYTRSGIGRQGICRICGIARAGTPYGFVSGRGRELLPHVCLVCIATGRTRS